MKRLLWVLLLVTACGSGATGTTQPEEPASLLEQYGGQASVYDEISRETDCAALQETFDRAAANNTTAEAGSAEQRYTLGYMTAAEERRQELGC